MDEHTATEEAYKNGYAEAQKECREAMLSAVTDAYSRGFSAGMEAQKASTVRVEPGLFDEVTEVHGCTVQILRNSITGEISIGWMREED